MNDQNHTYSYYFPSLHVGSKVPSATRMQIWNNFSKVTETHRRLILLTKKKRWKIYGLFNTFFPYCELFEGLFNPSYYISHGLQRVFENNVFQCMIKHFEGQGWDLPVAKSTSLNCWSESPTSSYTIWKDNHIYFFQLCCGRHILLSRSFFWDWDRSRWKSVANQLPLHIVCFQLELS